jgi:hypothetical protein
LVPAFARGDGRAQRTQRALTRCCASRVLVAALVAALLLARATAITSHASAPHATSARLRQGERETPGAFVTPPSGPPCKALPLWWCARAVPPRAASIPHPPNASRDASRSLCARLWGLLAMQGRECVRSLGRRPCTLRVGCDRRPRLAVRPALTRRPAPRRQPLRLVVAMWSEAGGAAARAEAAGMGRRTSTSDSSWVRPTRRSAGPRKSL